MEERMDEMKWSLAFFFVLLCGLFGVACDSEESELALCPGGPCEVPAECMQACEGVCQGSVGSFDCVEEECICECFFGCPTSTVAE
jgi:hypothetical protein